MKVILLKDVAKIGRKGSVIEVPDGFAQNKLLPNKMAKPATAENIKLHAHTQEVKQASDEKESVHFKELCKALETKTVTVFVETNEQGHMFQALKPVAIADALSEVLGEKIAPDHVTISAPIKSVGELTVSFSWGKNKKDIQIHIVAKK
jgi:large subunit ribosomal protein L9